MNESNEIAAHWSGAPPGKGSIFGSRLLRAGLLTLLALQPASALDSTSIGKAEEIQVLEERPGRGERCLVCGEEIHDLAIAEVRYKGRTFHVAAEMVDDFKSDPERYFRALEARSGLFDEAAVTAQHAIANYGWFGFGAYVLVGLLFAAGCGAIAVSRSKTPWPWFFAGLLLNAPALIFLLTRPRGDATTSPAGVPEGLRKVPTTRTPIPCPSCAAPVHPAARRCTRCRAALSPTIRAEAGA